ncbi:MAG TPA: TspO/MBR family protein [Patescibacteria group bacterium]|nr:TspO/MBR family protein [Patescibacteria group bacterium]
MKDIQKFLICVMGCELTGIIATPFTISAIPAWYAHLHKPFFSPPNWIFGPVWTLLYFFMGIAVFIIWQKGAKNKKVKKALAYFFIQLFLNFLWSIFFFGLRNPLLGFIDILFLLISIAITLFTFYKLSKTAGCLLIPYLLWVSFATILNFSLLLLNP